MSDKIRNRPALRALASRCGCLVLGCLFLTACSKPDAPPAATSARPEPMLVLYASLPEERLAAVARDYREATGIQVNYLSADGETLIEKLRLKEHRPGADVVLLAGATDLAKALDTDILRPLRSAALDTAVTAELRDPDGYWFGVGQRAEWIVYNARGLKPDALTGYAGLAADQWRGKLCLQRSTAGRSRSLVAALIDALGERDAELVVRGWRANLAANVFETQRELLVAIESGDCALGLVSSNEAALFIAAGLAEDLRVFAPTEQPLGSLLQPLGAGVSRHANDADRAQQFIEWLSSSVGQAALHATGADYPLQDAATLPEALAEWPNPEAGATPAMRSGYLHREAELLIERARYR